MTEQWQELKETITEMRDNDGTGTQQDVCKFLVNYMGVLEKQMVEQEPVLDKIRAEILEEKECAYADFERYKVEYLGQDWEDAYDSLPHNDFRYGMERCIEIIDRYRNEVSE